MSRFKDKEHEQGADRKKKSLAKRSMPPATYVRRGRPVTSILLILLVVSLFMFTATPVFAATAERQLYNGFFVETNGIAGAAVDTQSKSVLYDLDRKSQLPLTVASRLMLLLLVSEQFDAEQSVTISSEVARVETENPTPDQVRLETGQRVSVEFLTLRFLSYDSKGAIAALAEQFDQGIDGLVEMMNLRASTLELEQTVFEKRQDPDNSEYQLLPYSPFTSADDLMRISLQVLNNPKGLAYLSRGDAYLQIDAGGRRIVALRSPLTRMQVQTDEKIEAAYRASDAQYDLAFAFGQTQDGINVASLLISPQEPADDTDIITLFEAIENQYTRSRLVNRGDVVQNIVETAENGETFGLLYLDNISYTHPRNDPFLRQSFSYQGNPPYRLPIQPGIQTGQVAFELHNGYRVTVNVGPDRAILSESGTFSRFLSALQNNQNLTYILFGSIALLFLMLLFGIVRNIFRATYFYRLGGSRRKKDDKNSTK